MQHTLLIGFFYVNARIILEYHVHLCHNKIKSAFMFKINPYRPGTGLMPTYLTGRDADIYTVEQMFKALVLNIPTQ